MRYIWHLFYPGWLEIPSAISFPLILSHFFSVILLVPKTLLIHMANGGV